MGSDTPLSGQYHP